MVLNMYTMVLVLGWNIVILKVLFGFQVIWSLFESLLGIGFGKSNQMNQI